MVKKKSSGGSRGLLKKKIVVKRVIKPDRVKIRIKPTSDDRSAFFDRNFQQAKKEMLKWN